MIVPAAATEAAPIGGGSAEPPTVVLGIETSCDETAASVVVGGREVRSSVVTSQIDLHRAFGGVVPEIAGRAHLQLLPAAVSQALADAGIETPQAVAVTAGPGLLGALVVGVSAAKALALAWDVPFVAVNHLEAHLYAAFLDGAGHTGGATNSTGHSGDATDGTGHTGNATDGAGHSGGVTDGAGQTGGVTDGAGQTGDATDGAGHSGDATDGAGHTGGATNSTGQTGNATDGTGQTGDATDGAGHTGNATDSTGTNAAPGAAPSTIDPDADQSAATITRPAADPAVDGAPDPAIDGATDPAAAATDDATGPDSVDVGDDRATDSTPHGPTLPMVVLLVSGGHTMLIEMTGPGSYELLGQTLDDAAGEAFDKVARLLGLGYPGGPVIDRLSTEGNPDAIRFPRPMAADGLDFSFSGLKTAVAVHLRRHPDADPADVAASFQRAVTDVLEIKALRAAEARGVTSLCLAGGVAANSELRSRFEALGDRGMEVFIPSRAMCTDNAAMVAAAGWHQLRRQGPSRLDAAPASNWSIPGT